MTLANALDPDCTLVACVVDINARKQGHFVPGTGHPIVDFRELEWLAVRSVVNTNPNYRSENRAFSTARDYGSSSSTSTS